MYSIVLWFSALWFWLRLMSCPVCAWWHSLTALFHWFVRPVLAVLHIVTHLAAVNTLAVLAAELSWSIAFCNCEDAARWHEICISCHFQLDIYHIQGLNSIFKTVRRRPEEIGHVWPQRAWRLSKRLHHHFPCSTMPQMQLLHSAHI